MIQGFFTGDLRKYQQEAVDRAVAAIRSGPDRGFCFWLEMGTGKSRTALKVVSEIGTGGRVLVVCPKAVMPSWVAEIEATTTGVPAFVLEGSKAKRVKTLGVDSPGFFVINYDGLRVMGAELALGGFDVIIFDEAQRLSNRQAAQTKIATRLAQGVRYVLELTGTPVRNDATDLWSQLYIIDGGRRLGKNWWGFKNQYFVNVSRTRVPNWVPKKGSEETINGLVRDVAHVVKKADVLPFLPPKIYHRRVVDMGARQREAYIRMARDMVVELKVLDEQGHVATAETVLTRYLRLQQIAQGFLYDEDNKVVEEFNPNPKTAALLEILEDHAAESKNKVVVWAIFRKTIHDLMALLKSKGYNPVALYGDTSGDGVDRVFQTDDSVRVLIGQPRAGGLGVTLTAADMGIYFTNGWSHEDRKQSEDRCHRIGSETTCSVVNYVDLVARGTIDERVEQALRTKEGTSQMLTDFRRHIETVADAAMPEEGAD